MTFETIYLLAERESHEKSLLKEMFKKKCFNKNNSFKRERLCILELKPIRRNDNKNRRNSKSC
jgi:hypothetical protein